MLDKLGTDITSTDTVTDTDTSTGTGTGIGTDTGINTDSSTSTEYSSMLCVPSRPSEVSVDEGSKYLPQYLCTATANGTHSTSS